MPIPINISASTGAIILNLNDWATPTEPWLNIMESRIADFCEKNNYKKTDPPDSPEIQYGHAFEDAIIKRAEIISGFQIEDREKLFAIEDGIITCHIDGIYKNQGVIHEGKTTSIWYYADNFGEPGTDRVPVQYQIQCQHQMMCTGLGEAILSVLVFPKRPSEMIGEQDCKQFLDNIDCNKWIDVLCQMGFFQQFIINRNDELILEMKKNYLEWWDKHVINVTPPAPKNYDDIKRLIRAPSGTILANEELERISAEYKAIGKEKSEIDKRKDDLKTRLLDEMQKQISVKDIESADKWILRDGKGKKLHWYDGERFR